MKKFKVISLFCGCGGGDLGLIGGFNYLNQNYPNNPFEIIHASDINTKAVKTYNLNFDHKASIQDIYELDISNLKADVIIGGFPCQPFSTVNPTKTPFEKDGQLFWEMARVINDIRPSVFIAENVQGFYRLKNGFYFNLACDEFKKIGYRVFHKLLDASEYGVPQKRKRIFIVGVRNDIKRLFEFPIPTHGEDGSLSEKVKLSEIVKDLWPKDDKYFFSKRAVEGVKKAKPNMKRALAQDMNSQCLTITSHLAKVSLNSRDPVLLVSKENELYRRFTPQEAASIQSFPHDFKFYGSEGDAYRQVGNAISPVLMWHLSKCILKVLERKP